MDQKQCLAITFNQEIPRSLLRGYLAKGRGGRNRGVSPTMPFRLIPRSLLRGGFIHPPHVAVGVKKVVVDHGSRTRVTTGKPDTAYRLRLRDRDRERRLFPRVDERTCQPRRPPRTRARFDSFDGDRGPHVQRADLESVTRCPRG